MVGQVSQSNRRHDNRQQSLRQLNILYTPVEERFERITRLAKALYRVDIAGLSFQAQDHEWVKSVQGPFPIEIDLDASLNQILFDEQASQVVYSDVRRDTRASGSGLVTGFPSVRSFAAQAIYAPEGGRIGSFFIASQKAGAIGHSGLAHLRDLAALVQTEIHLSFMHKDLYEFSSAMSQVDRRQHLDIDTGLWGEEATGLLVGRRLERARKAEVPCGLLVMSMDKPEHIPSTRNLRNGRRDWGGIALSMLRALRPSDTLGRGKDGSFVALLPGCTHKNLAQAAERVRRNVERLRLPADLRPTVSIGAISLQDTMMSSAQALESADDARDRVAREGGNGVQVAPA